MAKRYPALCLFSILILLSSCTTSGKAGTPDLPEEPKAAEAPVSIIVTPEPVKEAIEPETEPVVEPEPEPEPVVDIIVTPAKIEPVIEEPEPEPELIIEPEPEPIPEPEPPQVPANLMEAIEANDLALAEGFILQDSGLLSARDAAGNTPLHTAAGLGETSMVSLLLKHGADPSIPNDAGQLPIHIAAGISFELAHNLLGNGSLLFRVDDSGSSALDLAFDAGPKGVSSLLGEQFVNSLDLQGNTPLQYAAQRGDLAVVNELIEYGADLNLSNSQGETPLDIAFTRTDSDIHVEIARVLIQNYAQIPNDQEFYYAYQTLSNDDVNIRFEGGTTPLHFAAAYHHPALLRAFIAEHGYLEARDEEENTPLHIAVVNGFFDITKLLVAAGADLDSRDAMNNSPLHLAVTSNTDTGIAEYLLDSGAEVDSRNSFGETPLHNAVSSAIDPTFVSLLLSYGAQPDSRNTSGNTPLMGALAEDNQAAAELLLDEGTDIYASNFHEISPIIRALVKGPETVSWFYRDYMNGTADGEGNSPLHIAVITGASTEAIALVIASGADLDKRNLQGETPMHLSVSCGYPEAARLLTQSGADPFINNNRGKSPLVLAYAEGIDFTGYIINEQNLQGSDTDGNTPLHLAALWDYPEAVSFLIDHGAAVNARNDQGLTPLHYAVKNNSVEICRILQAREAKIDARDNYGNTPLHTAISWGSSQCAKFLLLLKANVELRNLSGNTPMHTAVLHQDSLGINMLYQYGASLESRDNTGMTPLLLSTRKNFWTISELLIELGADYNTRDDRGNTPLHEAVRNKNQRTCGLLAGKGADIYAENSYGDTPLMIAFKAGVEVVDWFITGPMVFDRDDEGNTPLHTAIQLNASAEVIHSLIDKGADINSRNNRINTPLHNAFLSNNKTAVMVLVEAGADLFSRNGDGKTPLTLSFAMGLDALSWIVSIDNINSTDQYGNSCLHAAAQYGSMEAVEYMLNLGGDPTVMNLAGDTPAETALKNGHLDIMNRLRVFDRE